MDQSKLGKLRIPTAILLGLIFAMFGVFIFSNFVYRGVSLFDHIFPLFGTFDKSSEALYALLGSGLQVSFADLGTTQQIFNATVWPHLLTWSFGGFIVGTFTKGAKRSAMTALAIYFLLFFLWLIMALFATADLTNIFATNFKTTFSELMLVLVYFIPAALVGGVISGPYED